MNSCRVWFGLVVDLKQWVKFKIGGHESVLSFQSSLRAVFYEIDSGALEHESSCFISGVCCALQGSFPKCCSGFVCRGAGQPALGHRDELSSLSPSPDSAVWFWNTGKIHLNKAWEKWNQGSFSLSLVTQLFLLNSCPTHEVYRLGPVDLVPKSWIKQTFLLLWLFCILLLLTYLSFLFKLSAEDAERTRDVRWGRWVLFCADLLITPKGNELHHCFALFLCMESNTQYLLFQ